MATKQADDSEAEPAPGIGVDSRGGGAVDPTKNVGDLVKAESKKRDELREADKELVTVKIDAAKENVKLLSEHIVQFQNAMRDSETRRIDQLAENRQEFTNTIRDMLAESVRTTSTLVGNQLVQIQATFDTRVTKLEAYQLTQAGRTSVSDPATSEALAQMAVAIKNLGAFQDVRTGTLKGAGDNTAFIMSMVMAAIALASLAVVAFKVVT